ARLCAKLGATLAGAQALRRLLVEPERRRIDRDAVELPGGLGRDIALAHVLGDRRGRPRMRVAVAPAAARAPAVGVAALEMRHQHLGVRKVLFPFAGEADRHLVAGPLEAAVEAPRLAMGAIDLGIDRERCARPPHAIDAETAAMATGAA